MAAIRNTGIQASANSTYTVPWPSGTIAGDTAVIFVGQAWPMTPPAGWTVNNNLTGGWWDGGVVSKVLTAGDITAGSVTITFGGSFSGVIAILTTVGTCTVIQTVATQNPSPGNATVTLSTSAAFGTGDLVCYFGSNRAVDTVTVNRGTLQRVATDSVNGSGALYTETGITASTAIFSYPVPGDGNYQAVVVISSPLTLSCAGSATLSSAYFVVRLSRKNVLTGDLPPYLNSILSSITTLDGSIANWGLSPSTPSPANGTWSSTVTYALGDTVASANYAIRTAAGALIAPLTYRSLQTGNLGHDPDSYGGQWTCITQPPNATNSNFVPVPFGYSLSPLPTKTTLAAAQWQAGLGHSLSWSVLQPGDVIQMLDLNVTLNYIAGSSIIPVVLRPLGHSAGTGGQGYIANPGVNAQFQCWFTSGLSTTPYLTLNAWEPMVEGMQPDGTVGTPYLSALIASGGTPPYAYGIIAGSLPPGITLDGLTGVISGTPTASGIFDFTAQVTDNTGATATVTCAIPIECGAAAAAANNRFY